jgi:hypothetical protein
VSSPLASLSVDKLRLAKVENVSVATGTERTLLDATGPGTVKSLWMALGGGNGPALDARLRVYYDSAAVPSIDIDMGTLLATHFGAGSVAGSHTLAHVHAEINSNNFNTGFLLTFPMPFGTRIMVAYFNASATQTAVIYSMAAYALTATDQANGVRLRQQGARYLDQRATRTASQTTTLASITGGPGWIVYHSQVCGVGATNLSWMERNVQIAVDGEATPAIVSTGTEDWFDSAWYFNGWKDFDAGVHSYVGTDRPAAPNQYVVGMATDLMSKWGGVHFNTSAVMTVLTEPACTTGDTLCWCILYYR